MTRQEFKIARYALGLSVVQLGRILDTDPRNIRRWENGSRPPNPTACQVLRWMQAGFRPEEFSR